MAGGSLKKKFKKGSNPKPHSPRSIPSKSSHLLIIYWKSSIAIFIMLFSCVFFMFGITSNTWFRGSESYDPAAEVHTIQVVRDYPHDPRAFTQGLLYAGNESLFESTGQYGESSVRKVALHTGKVEAIQKMDYSYFGEGLTLLGDRLFQLTWLKKTGFIYHRNNLTKLGQFTHQMKDGWGLTTNGEGLFGSDGSSTLYIIHPRTLKVIGQQTVKYKGHEVYNLNELEFINGEVWANVWQTDCIARISHRDGNVIGWILLQNLRESLLASGERYIDVLNGIAWDDDKKRLFVTGKWWPKLYEIRLHLLKKQLNGAVEQLCLRQPFRFNNS